MRHVWSGRHRTLQGEPIFNCSFTGNCERHPSVRRGGAERWGILATVSFSRDSSVTLGLTDEARRYLDESDGRAFVIAN